MEFREDRSNTAELFVLEVIIKRRYLAKKHTHSFDGLEKTFGNVDREKFKNIM